MAGGKLSPRQKMINLMYLVFIAMMALNMSKEVLTAFGLMNKKFEAANKVMAESTNQVLFDGLALKAGDEPEKYGKAFDRAKEVQKLSNEFYAYLESLKADATKGFKLDPETGDWPFEQMDKGQGIDYGWFEGDGLSAKGKEIKDQFAKYRSDFKAIVADDTKFQILQQSIDDKFNTEDVKNKDNKTIEYLDYHFKGYPAVSSLAYLSSLQNDVRTLENEAYNLFLGNSLKQAASMRNYQAMVIPDKAVYYQGEPINYTVVLGRYDTSTVPNKVVVNGNTIPQSQIVGGQVQGTSVASGLGEHKFTGKYYFTEDGESFEVDVKNSNYVVVSRPSSATISADKMNVVYAGLDNPISITVEGITSDKVSAVSSNGALKKVGNGKYMLTPTGGKEVVITATGTMPDGKAITSKQTFRVKTIPRPQATIRGTAEAKGSANNLKNSDIGAMMEDFDFDVKLRVTEYVIFFPGMGSERVSGGGKMPASAQSKVDRLKPGDKVTITSMKVKIDGVNLPIKEASAATFTIL
ncbi:gliding motility-associated protein GldM [Paenimyroides aquimaris]|uniref:Gliding motility-associated protein GldM n=1 Tax=Paenimyroides marinum TaxID=1159016 RepID=A0A1H6L3H9_9FLAO|nr:gliding motility protein GldM [Paenimyroides aquimaris]SEH78801.1 gliding motility-associated protein GldM [Paenimyroides aquimaris]